MPDDESSPSGVRSASAGPNLETRRRASRMRGSVSERPASEGPKRRGRSRGKAETARPSQPAPPVQSRIQALADVLGEDDDAEGQAFVSAKGHSGVRARGLPP